jgi:hypothetical protein
MARVRGYGKLIATSVLRFLFAGDAASSITGSNRNSRRDFAVSRFRRTKNGFARSQDRR